ncbi:MAG TPA: hypothetical protein P5538_00090 [Bacteroidales bacterium]|nr:hypothetical protein [Bacteroidales bacterium]HPD24444.1 hypothetical protein [Bacteroidales bacterium]HRS98739.1 hypothetical protein [Bacteroidales bacterium]HRT79327.1 hypothetical protein [Bacteroidales bacterium]
MKINTTGEILVLIYDNFMLNTFKTNSPFNYILILIIFLIFWGYKIIYVPTDIESYPIISPLLPDFPESFFFNRLQTFLGLIVYFIIAFLIIKINSDLFIVENGYQSPGVIFALLTGYYINNQRITGVLLGSMFLFLTFSRIFKSINDYKAYGNFFNAGLFWGLGILFYPKLIVMFPIIVISMFMIRTVLWREPLFFLSGFLIPILYYFAFYFFKSDYTHAVFEVRGLFYNAVIPVAKSYLTFQYLIFVPQLLIILIAVISRFTIKKSSKVSSRRFLTVITLITVFILAYLVSHLAELEAVIIIYPFISILLSYMFINLKEKTAKIFIGIFVLTIIFTHVLQIYYYSRIF